MIKQSAAERYARALFDLAKEEKAIDQFGQDLTEVFALLQANTELEKLLYHPRVQESDKKEMMTKILRGQVKPLILNFILLLIDKGRINLLKEMIELYHQMAQEAKGIVEVQVETAFTLSPENRMNLTAKLKQMTGKEIAMKEAVNPALIGGIRIRVGDKVIDGTIERHLERIKESLAQLQVSQLGVS